MNDLKKKDKTEKEQRQVGSSKLMFDGSMKYTSLLYPKTFLVHARCLNKEVMLMAIRLIG